MDEFAIPLSRPLWTDDEQRAYAASSATDVAAFEAELAAACGRRWAVTLWPGWQAVRLALVAVGVGPGETVRVPALLRHGFAAAVADTGAVSEIVDVNPATWCMRLPPRLAGRRRSLVVNELGFPARSWAGDVCIAPAAPPLPATTQASCTCLDFDYYMGGPLEVECAAIVGDDDGLGDTVRDLAAAAARGGPPFVYTSDAAGAAMLRVRLARLGALHDERRRIAARYLLRLAGSRIQLQADFSTRTWSRLAVLLPPGAAPAEVVARLAAAGIEAGAAVHPHDQLAEPAVADQFPVAADIARRSLALPLWSGLGDAEVDRVAEALLAAIDAPR